jgi:hypothetical protein
VVEGACAFGEKVAKEVFNEKGLIAGEEFVKQKF